MIYLYALLSIAIGVFLAWKGLSQYRLLLSVAVAVFSASFSLSMAELQPGIISPVTGIIVALIFGAITYVLAKWISYAWLYSFLFSILLLCTIVISNGEAQGGGVLLAIVVAPIVGVYFLRHHIKPLVIGMLSGYSIGAGLATFIFILFIETGDFLASLTVPVLVMLALTLLGVVFQYAYILKRNPELAKI